MDFRILGPLEVVGDSGPVVVGALKQQTLLAVLLLQANAAVQVDRLIEELWGEQPPASAAKLVQGYVSQLRKGLGADVVVRRTGGYAVVVAEGGLDAAEFERAVDEARGAPPERALALLQEALGLWRGPALAGLSPEGPARWEVERLNEGRVDAVLARVEAGLECGRAADLVGELQELVSKDPRRERPRALLMLALYRSGRQADALRVYRETRELLVEELGVEPGVELQELERAILNQDPSLRAGMKPAARPPTTLPTPPTMLIGRERELAEAGSLLRKHRLLTLTGPGGSGKTRLAIELAVRAGADTALEVVWVPLQAVRDAQLVLPAIARTIGTSAPHGAESPERRLLLVLDNLEQVVAAAPALADLLARFPAAKMLATSREPLHLAGEREYPVGPLPEEEAVALFMERATAVRPDLEPDDAVPEICRRLDCLPLALELAAARAKLLSTEDLLRRLSRRLPLLTGGPRDAPERQRTLRAAIAWSHELLAPEEQRVFARLAIFANGCTLEAAEDVCEADLDTLAALVDKSLLRREGDRYSLLETIGEYAFERLEDAGELDAVRARHAEYYLGQARSVEAHIRSPQAAALLDRLERDHENLRLALARQADADSDDALRLAVWGLAGRLHSLGDAAFDRDDLAEAARLYRESVELALRLRDLLLTAYSLGGLAAVAARRGARGAAARLWGAVHALEHDAGETLHDAERRRYEVVVGEIADALDASAEFGRGRAMSLEEAVAYALALD